MSARPPRADVLNLLRPAALALGAAVSLAVLPGAPGVAGAGTEEFSTFDVEAQEEDDESLLDHVLTRMPRAWRDEWERSPMAIRSAQGCLTSGQWINQTDLKLRTPLGRRAWFGLAMRQDQGDRVNYEFTDFTFHFPTRLGTAGYLFRPFHDKSRQDMALLWDVGADTSAFQVRAVFGLEDVFNNFWEFRQSRVGEASEPYLRRPWEPGLTLAIRRPRLRAEAGGRYLTPSVKQVVISAASPNLDHLRTLWGTLAWATVEATALGIDWELHGRDHQARSAEWQIDTPQPDGANYRRQWSVEAGARRQLGGRFAAEARWLYQDRTQQHAPPVAPARFAAVDRVIQLETLWNPSSRFGVRFGGLHDRLSVTPSGIEVSRRYGSRTESRLYLGLIARFGRVSLQGVEGIELDHEPYEVWAVHDKGFLQLQATF